MFAYYFQLGLRSLRRNPILTALMVMAIGFGVAASMTTYAVFRATSSNPIPQKSSQLYAVQVDNWGPEDSDKGEPPQALDVFGNREASEVELARHRRERHRGDRVLEPPPGTDRLTEPVQP